MDLVSHKLHFAFSLYLGVGLAAVGADVSLHVFGIAMLGDVLQQRWLVCEALVAGVALVRLVTLMASRVRLQVRQLRECLRATWGTKRLARLWWGKNTLFWRFLPEVQSIDRTDRHSVRA